MIGQDDRATLARALAEDRWFEAQKAASDALHRWVRAEAAMTALFNAVGEPAWVSADDCAEGVSTPAASNASTDDELLAEARSWGSAVASGELNVACAVGPPASSAHSTTVATTTTAAAGCGSPNGAVIPLDDPPAYTGNVYKDRFYRWYPPKRIAPAPLSRLQLRHVDIVQAASAARAEWLDALLAFSRTEEVAACPGILADARTFALRVQRCLEALFAARDNPTARRRSFFRRSVDAQENAAHDSKYAAEASAVEHRVLEIVDALQSEAAYTLAPIPLVDSRGISDLAFVGRDHLTYDGYRRAVATARRRRGLPLEAALFPHHRTLVWRGLLPPNDPINDEEDYTAQVDAVHGRRPRWGGDAVVSRHDDSPILLPRWAAAAVAQGLGGELPAAATKLKVSEGLEGHGYRHGTFPACTPPVAQLRAELAAAATDRGSQEAPMEPLGADAIAELQQRVDWLENDAGRDVFCCDDGRWTNAMGAIHGDDALARDPRTACPTAFGIRRLEADEHLADVESRADLLPFRLAIPFQRLVPEYAATGISAPDGSDGGHDADAARTAAFIDRITKAPIAVEAAAGELCPEPSQMFELLGQMPLASVAHPTDPGAAAHLVEHVYDNGLQLFVTAESGAWHGLRLHTAGWSGAGWRPPVEERLEPALQRLLEHAGSQPRWDAHTETFRGELSLVHVMFRR